MTFQELSKRGWKWARDYRPKRRLTDDGLFSHLHSEVSEAWRDCTEGNLAMTYSDVGKPHGLPSELADVVIMAAIIAGKHKIDLDAAVESKFAELDKRLLEKELRRG